jgi:hypothetical protein
MAKSMTNYFKKSLKFKIRLKIPTTGLGWNFENVLTYRANVRITNFLRMDELYISKG